ncbi:peptidylprolyl isomerase [Candidatus Peregrinibacteria bacterium]|nr:MAG: peptidylprolyl isomerase [Candidatus Peregrinibacteria bacterium]
MKFYQKALPAKGEQIIVIETSEGTVSARLFPDHAPKAVENFLGLMKLKYYNGTIFHRVIFNFMIQAGDPTATGKGGESIWKTHFNDEFHPELKHIRGAMAMANHGPNTNGSQFFVVEAPETPWLDKKHTVFGQIFEGLDIIDLIANADVDENDRPLKDIVLKNITLTSYA